MKIKIEDEGEKVKRREYKKAKSENVKRQKVKGENAFITIYQL